MSPLTARWEIASVSQPTVRADLGESLQVVGYVTPQIALNLETPLDHLPDPDDFLVAQQVCLLMHVDLCLGADTAGRAPADSVHVGQGDLHAFVSGQIDP
jgi:hypothetical protein